MLTGPPGQRRPAGMISCAVNVASLSVASITEALKTPSSKVRSGHAGDKARSESLTQDPRRKIARDAAGAGRGYSV